MYVNKNMVPLFDEGEPDCEIWMDGERVQDFKYLGDTFNENEEMEAEDIGESSRGQVSSSWCSEERDVGREVKAKGV